MVLKKAHTVQPGQQCTVPLFAWVEIKAAGLLLRTRELLLKLNE